MGLISSKNLFTVTLAGAGQTEPFIATSIVVRNSGASVTDALLSEGDGVTTMATVTVPADSSITLPFGPRGKYFPNGIDISGSGTSLIVFLA